MNLYDTVQALEVKGVIVALDIGIHYQCSLDSNCPLAIQLRRLVADAGITLEQLMEGYQEVTAPDPVSHWLPEFSSDCSITVGGKTLDLDFNDIISEQLAHTVTVKLRELDRLKGSVRNVGDGLYQAYLREIRNVRQSQTLSQINFSVDSLIESGCMITSSGNEYKFLFPSEYNPQYITKWGVRYKMSDEDIKRIKRQVYFRLTITQDGRFLRADVLDGEGRKLCHYHGDESHDCWGDVSLPEKWDGRLGSLTRLVHTLTRSLITINRDSLVNNEPVGMPRIDVVLGNSTELGEEGRTGTPADTTTATPARRTRWGERR